MFKILILIMACIQIYFNKVIINIVNTFWKFEFIMQAYYNSEYYILGCTD